MAFLHKKKEMNFESQNAPKTVFCAKFLLRDVYVTTEVTINSVYFWCKFIRISRIIYD